MSPHRSLAPATAAQARRRQLTATFLGLLVVVAAVVGLITAFAAPSRDDPGGGAPTAPSTSATSSSPTAPRTSARRATASPTSTSPTLPEYQATGRFTRLAASTPVRGDSGELVTYRIEVEQGSRVGTGEFGRAVDRALSHPRGWTGAGKWRFKRVVDAEPDLIIRLATPASVDEQCRAAGADTDGYTSCRAGQYIVLNLDRWFLGVPHVDGLTTYRTYLVNHEVGHGLGLGHQACPAKGEPAPVMLQQTLRLGGCTPNPWPYDADGELVSGPPTP